MNLHWEKLFNIFIPFVKSMDKMEKQKQIFMKAKIDEFMKIKSQFYSSLNIEDKQNQHYFKERQERYKLTHSIFLHDLILQKSGLHISLDKKSQITEKFVSYERHVAEKEKTAFTGGFIIVGDDTELSYFQLRQLRSLNKYLILKNDDELDEVRKINLENLFAKEKAVSDFFQCFDQAWADGLLVFENERKTLLIQVFKIINEELMKNSLNVGHKVYQLLKILNSSKVVSEGKQVPLFEYFDDSKLWSSYELWEQLYKTLLNGNKGSTKIEGQIKEIFKFVKSMVSKEAEHKKKKDRDNKMKLISFDKLVDQMKRCKKSIKRNQGKEIIQTIGK